MFSIGGSTTEEYCDTLDNTEIITMQGIKQGPKLPYEIERHCMELYENDKIIIATGNQRLVKYTGSFENLIRNTLSTLARGKYFDKTAAAATGAIETLRFKLHETTYNGPGNVS